MKPAAALSDGEIIHELDELKKKWDSLRKGLEEDGGHGGSPGEWMYERMDELETEQNRRIKLLGAG